MNDDKCCIGYGYVGRSTALAFNIEKHFSRSDSNITLEQASRCRYIFICLPTPTIDGKCFTGDIYKIIEQINQYPRHVDNIFIIRSTVYPGFANYVKTNLGIEHVVSNPEFISEDSWQRDAINPWMIVVGADDPRYREIVKGLYMGRYKYTQPIETDNKTAELLKYSMNTFFATKVIFANEIWDYCQKIGANYETIKRALENSPWGSKNHFQIVYKDKRGVNGNCLPKDLEALSVLTGSKLFKTMLEINEKLK